MSNGSMAAGDVDVDLGRLFAGIRRKWLRLLLAALVITGLVFALLSMATPKYKAETRLLIETRESVFTRPQVGTGGDQNNIDGEGVASQVELLTSTELLAQVVDKLKLADREEFSGGDGSLATRVMVMTGLKSDPGNAPQEERVLRAFRERLTVYRVENSRVIVIEFSSQDPRLAAEVANAVADAYVAMQGEAKLQSNNSATQWLEPEIEDLRKRVKDAESRVAEYRAQSDLLLGQNNTVLATQQLAEMSSELSRMRANRADAEAKASAVRSALSSGAPVDSQPEVLASPVIQRLRERQAELQAEIADLSTTLLGNHPRIRALRSQLGDIDGQIRAEAGRVLGALDAEAETARRRETELTAEMNRLKVVSAKAEEEQVELRALEREAAAQRELLESYLTRYREAVSRSDRNYLPVDVRIFSRAITPGEPYFPKVVPITVAAFIASLLVMAVITLLQELFSGRAMRPSDERDHVEPVPAVPMEPAEPAEIDDKPARNSLLSGRYATVDERHESERPLVPKIGEIDVEEASDKLISGGASRALFISPEGDEAAAASVLVAREVADSGLRVLLLDLTSSGAASLPMLESIAFTGITNLLASEAQFADVIHSDHFSEAHVIPVGTADPVRAMRAASRLPIILESLGAAYDVVIVECGPADADAIRQLIAADTEVMVAVLDPDHGEIAVETLEELRANGIESPTLVTPSGVTLPPAPPGRDAA
ncbi:exopolysaccharide transport family protein [Nitratireductor indicus C115]|uniref:Exopolysaccharide transport family protein n=1 Tax=Nitratireductor indicus C115 TaxID=1231190 RepID=K2N5S6_9HYPH|nr:exopolysaccharide transport family protein [Nitratireductor indicus]EKF42808.1 exopolysaccharide transport family protein [Nitratireductor indicus C115]SFQ40556.1 exopolysaccharide transport protein family [Nitratireductor indicus]